KRNGSAEAAVPNGPRKSTTKRLWNFRRRRSLLLHRGGAPIAGAEFGGMGAEPAVADRLTQAGHQPLVEPEIMLGHQHRAEDLAGADEMMDIGALPCRADRARAARLDRFAILGEAGVADVDRPIGSKRLAGATGPR